MYLNYKMKVETKIYFLYFILFWIQRFDYPDIKIPEIIEIVNKNEKLSTLSPRMTIKFVTIAELCFIT